MPAIPPDCLPPPLAELAVAHDFAIEQHSPATRKAYRSDFALFALWCTARGLNACPAAPKAVCAFIADEASSGIKVATITRRIAAIRYAHALKGVDPLPTSSETVRATMKGIRRTKGAAQIRKAPATHGIIADMIASCPETLRGTRDRALLLLGLCRRLPPLRTRCAHCRRPKNQRSRPAGHCPAVQD